MQCFKRNRIKDAVFSASKVSYETSFLPTLPNNVAGIVFAMLGLGFLKSFLQMQS